MKLVEPPVDLKCPLVDDIAFCPNEPKVNLPKSYKILDLQPPKKQFPIRIVSLIC